MSEHEHMTWDYRVETAPTSSALTALGDDGWELVAIDPTSGGYVFKRPRPSFRDRVTLEQKRRYYELWARQREAEA